MYDFIIGKVEKLNNNSIVINNNNIGYLIHIVNPFSYEIDSEIKLYLYQQIKEDEHLLFGFKTIEEKELFLKLISVKGLGPKMTLPILAVGSITGIMEAIEKEDILYLKKFPKIGDKLAKQMILDLKGKLNTEVVVTKEDNHEKELIDVLTGLGYKAKEIKAILPKISKDLTIEDMIKEALKLMLK